MYSPPQAAWYLSQRRRKRRANSLAITATPVETATVNVAYAGFTATGAGGTDPYTFSGFGFPAGIAIDEAGEVAGTPTETGSFNPSIVLTDIEGSSSRLTFPLTVSA